MCAAKEWRPLWLCERSGAEVTRCGGLLGVGRGAGIMSSMELRRRRRGRSALARSAMYMDSSAKHEHSRALSSDYDRNDYFYYKNNHNQQ